MIQTYNLEDLERYRELARPTMQSLKRDILHTHYLKDGVRLIGGGAPSLMTVLATLPAAATANTYTTAQSILSSTTTNQTSIGPFSTDYFKTTGATWEQEAMGIISVTSATTPTFAMGTYYGVVIGTVTTVLCITGAQTTISGMQNVNWYWNAFGHTRTITGTTGTMLCTGILIGQLAIAAAGNNSIYAVNATPPTAVTTDFSTNVFIDLKGTWGTSASTNTTTVNFYNLKSLYA